MTDAQLKALQFLRDVDRLDYDRAAMWNYPHRSKLPCTGGALKVLIRSLTQHGWMCDGALTEQGETALNDYINKELEDATRRTNSLAEFEP